MYRYKFEILSEHPTNLHKEDQIITNINRCHKQLQQTPTSTTVQ